MPKTLTTCIYCGCGCGLYLEAEDKEVIGASPSYGHPVSRGALCVKGWNCYEFINNPDRLSVPLIKKNDAFQPTSWEEALALISKKFFSIKEKYGPDALSFLSSAKATNEENYLLMKLARAVFGTNNIDHCARLCHASTVSGLSFSFGSGAMTNSINEFEGAELILTTGSDTTAQHPLIGSRIVNAVLERGTKLILVDPRKIELSKYAYLHLAQRCGTDVAWINAMMHIIIKENLYNHDFINNRCENFEELKSGVLGYTPEHVEKITGIPKEKLIKAARLYAKTKKAMIVYSMGITQHTTGVDNVKSLANLCMLCGKVGYASSGVNPLRGQNNVQGACDMGALPNLFSGYQPLSDPAIRKKFTDAWGVGSLPERTGLTVTEILGACNEGAVKGLFILGENPVLSDPDITHVKEALENTEFLVVSELFLSETAEYADVVLPAASFAEKEGTFTNTDRRIQKIRRAIAPLGNAKPDWQIICGIAKYCGYQAMDYKDPSEIMSEIASLTPIYGGVGYARLEPYGLQWPCPDKNHPGTPILHKEKFTRGKGLFAFRPYIGPKELPDAEYNFTLTTGRIYWHWHTGTMTRRTSLLEREAPEAFAELNPDDAKDLNIRDKEMIKISSRRGTINIRSRVSERTLRGVVFIPFHFKEAAANVLTINAVDPEAKIPEFKVCAVKVEKIKN
ncbi:MAG: formate dehydrogenase subunit alpha [Candidatus Omnitrophota bacterium]